MRRVLLGMNELICRGLQCAIKGEERFAGFRSDCSSMRGAVASAHHSRQEWTGRISPQSNTH